MVPPAQNVLLPALASIQCGNGPHRHVLFAKTGHLEAKELRQKNEGEGYDLCQAVRGAS
jgi:hypothetical protein